jgi:hypothetical protein
VKKAILLTGFQNWGKTTHIHSLFGRARFYQKSTYTIQNVNANFTVESRSNDDLGKTGFTEAVTTRIGNDPDGGRNIFCAFCPTKEPWNESQQILNGAPFTSYSEIHVLLLQHKWDLHAELRINDIQTYLGINQKIKFFAVSGKQQPAREKQIINYLQGVYP